MTTVVPLGDKASGADAHAPALQDADAATVGAIGAGAIGPPGR